MSTLAAGAIKSTTHENALLEIAMQMQVKEGNATSNPNNKNNVQVTFNTDAKTCNIQVTLPITQGTNTTTGAIEFTAEEYLT